MTESEQFENSRRVADNDSRADSKRLTDGELDKRIVQVNGWASEAYDIVHDVGLTQEWEAELVELQQEKRLRASGQRHE